MGLENATAAKKPTEYGALPKDELGESCNDDFIDTSSIVGMFLYLQGHARPEIAFSVS